MSLAYKLCKMMIEKGITDGLKRKMEVYMMANSITEDEFLELCSMLPESTN